MPTKTYYNIIYCITKHCYLSCKTWLLAPSLATFHIIKSGFLHHHSISFAQQKAASCIIIRYFSHDKKLLLKWLNAAFCTAKRYFSQSQMPFLARQVCKGISGRTYFMEQKKGCPFDGTALSAYYLLIFRNLFLLVLFSFLDLSTKCEVCYRSSNKDRRKCTEYYTKNHRK